MRPPQSIYLAAQLPTRKMSCIAHLVSLRDAAGVEAHFAEFVRTSKSLFPHWDHIWLNPAGDMHPIIRERIGDSLDAIHDAKRLGGIRLPSIPRALRSWHSRRLCRRNGANVGIVWNRTARCEFFLDALGDENIIHWEHGRAWHAGRENERQRYLDRVRFVIANSNAAKRVLELRWGYLGELHVCLNALRPGLVPSQPQIKTYPSSRPIRLGAVARLQPVKGLPLAIHALKYLISNGLDAELHIAGDGPDRESLERLASKLGIGERVRLHGIVSDMPSFYASIDCLVHLPITEAFGLVGLEAAAYGCPIVAAAVDGLPEAVQDEVSGHCLRPSLPLSDYEVLGSSSFDIPPQVYDPQTDSMRAPHLVDPGQAADSLGALFANAEAFEAISRSSAKRVLRQFRFEDHLNAVFQAIESFEQG